MSSRQITRPPSRLISFVVYIKGRQDGINLGDVESALEENKERGSSGLPGEIINRLHRISDNMSARVLPQSSSSPQTPSLCCSCGESTGGEASKQC